MDQHDLPLLEGKAALSHAIIATIATITAMSTTAVRKANRSSVIRFCLFSGYIVINRPIKLRTGLRLKLGPSVSAHLAVAEFLRESSWVVRHHEASGPLGMLPHKSSVSKQLCNTEPIS